MIPFRLSFAHFRRNKLRTALTVLSVTITVFLFCALRTVVTALDSVTSGATSTRIVTQSAVSLFVQMPIAMWQRVRATDGVIATTHWTWFGGKYGDPDTFFARFGIDVPSTREVYGDKAPEGSGDIVLPTAEWDEFEATRNSCVIGDGLAQMIGKKKGDRIALTGGTFFGEYQFTVVGVYRSGTTNVDSTTMFFHWDYMNEQAGRPNRVSVYTSLLDSIDRMGGTISAIDATFESSSTRTRTYTERAFNAQFVTMWGNVPLLLGAIGVAVFFACFMITMNTMLLLARERFRETGILKAIGFRDGSVAGVSLFESILLCLAGAGLGVVISLALLQRNPMFDAFLPGFQIKVSTMREAIGIGLLLGVLSGLAPFWYVKRLSVIDSLRKVV